MMPRTPALTLIIPAYNEVGSIGRTLDEAQSYLDGQGLTYEIIVSADGDDGTREFVHERAQTDPRVSVLGSCRRGGKGRGIRLGVAQARGRIIGFADADNKTPISELAKFWPCFAEGCDLVIGSRGMADSQIELRQPFHRRIGSRGFGIAMRLITGLWGIRDTQCGFKFFRHEAAKEIFRRQRIDGYMFDVEVLCLARRLGYRIREIGVRWRDDGDSRLRLVAGNWQNLVDLLRIRFGRANATPLAAADRPASPDIQRERPAA
jgi:dolichyl-phosphate beta-glucosyltransferase